MTSSSSPFGPPPPFVPASPVAPAPPAFAPPPVRDPYLGAALDRIAAPGFPAGPPAFNPPPSVAPPPDWSNEGATLAAIEEWLKAKASHAKAQRIERELRTKMLRLAFPLINWDLASYGEWTGTHRYKMPGDLKLKLSVSDTYEIENSDAMDKALASIPEATAETLVSWKPAISKTMYLALSAEQRKIMSKFVTIKGNSPQVEIEGLD
jgi:hypothetical protein